MFEGNDFVFDKLEAIRTMLDEIETHLAGKPQETPTQAIDYDTEKIKWTDMPDAGKGPWQLAKIDDNRGNVDFERFLNAVSAGGDATRTKAFFVWKMGDGSLGQKLWKYVRKRKP